MRLNDTELLNELISRIQSLDVKHEPKGYNNIKQFKIVIDIGSDLPRSFQPKAREILEDFAIVSRRERGYK